MRGRYEHGAGARRRAYAGPHVDAVLVDRHVTKLHFGGGERAVGHRVARILHPHFIAAAQQHADHDIDCVLGARGDDDLIRLATHRARGLQIIANAAAQPDETACVRIAKMDRVERTQRPRAQLPPHIRRSRIDQRARCGERPGLAFRRRMGDQFKGLFENR